MKQCCRDSEILSLVSRGMQYTPKIAPKKCIPIGRRDISRNNCNTVKAVVLPRDQLLSNISRYLNPV